MTSWEREEFLLLAARTAENEEEEEECAASPKRHIAVTKMKQASEKGKLQ